MKMSSYLKCFLILAMVSICSSQKKTVRVPECDSTCSQYSYVKKLCCQSYGYPDAEYSCETIGNDRRAYCDRGKLSDDFILLSRTLLKMGNGGMNTFCGVKIMFVGLTAVYLSYWLI